MLSWLGSALFATTSAVAPAPGPCEPEPPGVEAPPPVWDRPGPRASATPPGTRLTFSWALAQLVPSPELAVGRDGALFGLRWQLTPFSYSFGIDRRLSPFRSFVVEPLFRTSGSLELFFAPEYLALDSPQSKRFGFRTGVRAFFPVLERGDYVSVSVGAAYARFGDVEAAAYQAGVYILFGFLGLEQSFAPALAEARWITTFNLRFF